MYTNLLIYRDIIPITGTCQVFRKGDFNIREVTGYYDGTAVQLLEPAPKTKQKVIMTFIDDEDVFDDLPVDILLQYASAEKRLLEE